MTCDTTERPACGNLGVLCAELEFASHEGDARRAQRTMRALSSEQIRATGAVYTAALNGHAELVRSHAPHGYMRDPDLTSLKLVFPLVVARKHEAAARALLDVFGIASYDLGVAAAWLRQARA